MNEKQMKVLFSTYPTAFQFPGGGELILEKSYKHLRAKRIDVKLFDQWKDKISDYDVLHNFGPQSDCASIVHAAHSAGVKVAVHTIYWPMNEYALRGDIPLRERVKKLAYNFFNKHNMLGISKMRNIIDTADVLFPNSQIEADMLAVEFGTDRGKIHVVPDGVDERFFGAAPDEFVKKFGVKDFVLYVGRLEPRRNLLGLIRAMKLAGVKAPLVVIGAEDPVQKEYADACKREAPKGTVFTGRIMHDSTLLASAYAAAKVFVAPTWAETPGLAAMEAGMALTNIVITTRGCAKEYFLDYADYIDPTNTMQLGNAIKNALEKEPSKKLAQHLKKNYTWGAVADITIKGYKKALKS